MIRHLSYFVKYAGVALGIFIVVGQLGFFALKPLVERSNFRIAVAGNADKKLGAKKLILLTGDSRLMDGFNARKANQEYDGGEFVYNFAFNGLRFADSVFIVETVMKKCSGRISKVYINAQGLEDETLGTSELQVFVSAFNTDLIGRMNDKSWVFKESLKLLPLLHFNNEVFQRSVYYTLINGDDQDHGNAYNFKIHARMIEGIKKSETHFAANKRKVALFVRYLKGQGAELVILLTPFHGTYILNRLNFQKYVKEIQELADSVGVDCYDHSSLFLDKPEYFADMLHMNVSGQKAYTEYLVNHVFKKAKFSSRAKTK